MPAPKKGKRFGKSASHQKLMLANLAVHLIISEADAITTTESKAKALRSASIPRRISVVSLPSR